MNLNASLTKAAPLIKNSLYSFGSRVIPLFIGLVAIPILIELLGVTRFGILTLAWVFIGYSNIFDFGMSRAGVKFISNCIGENKKSEIPQIFWTLIIVLFSMGGIIAIILYISSSDLLSVIMESNGDLESEVLYVIRLVALTLPVVLLISGLNAYLTAYQQFKWISFIQVINGSLNYLAPVFILLFFDGLVPVMITLLSIKILILGLYIFTLWQYSIDKLSSPTFSFRHMNELANYGGWVSVSNVLSPLIDYIDRFYIAFIIGAGVVAFFTTPMDVLLKLGIIPVSIASVLFPGVSNLSRTDKDKAIRFTTSGVNLTLIILFPVVVILILFAEEFLYLWVGSEFAEKSTLVAQILLIGIFLKSFTNYSVTYLHGIGKPRQTALVHVGETLVYVLVLYYAVREFELIGAAVIHTVRLSIDFCLMNLLVYRYGYKLKPNILKSTAAITLGVVLLISFIFIDDFIIKIIVSIILIPVSMLMNWYSLVDEEVKKTLFSQIPAFFRSD